MHEIKKVKKIIISKIDFFCDMTDRQNVGSVLEVKVTNLTQKKKTI